MASKDLRKLRRAEKLAALRSSEELEVIKYMLHNRLEDLSEEELEHIQRWGRRNPGRVDLLLIGLHLINRITVRAHLDLAERALNPLMIFNRLKSGTMETFHG